MNKEFYLKLLDIEYPHSKCSNYEKIYLVDKIINNMRNGFDTEEFISVSHKIIDFK